MTDSNNSEGGSSADVESVEKDDKLGATVNDALGDFNKTIVHKESDENATGSKELIDIMLLENILNEPSIKEAVFYLETTIKSVIILSNGKSSKNQVSSTKTNDSTNVILSSGKPVDVNSLMNDFQSIGNRAGEIFKKEIKNAGVCVKGEEDLFAEEFSKRVMEIALSTSFELLKNLTTKCNNEVNAFHDIVRDAINNITTSINKNAFANDSNISLKDIINDKNLITYTKRVMNIYMSTIKSLVYPLVKDYMCNILTKYSEDGKSNVSKDELESYEQQYHLLKKISLVFDSEGETTTNEPVAKGIELCSEETERVYKKFLSILNSIKDTNMFGQIPDEFRHA